MRPLPPEDVRRLAGAAYTYPGVGGTASGVTPPGFRDLHVLLDLHTPFEVAHERLMRWRMQEGAGLRVHAGTPRVEVGSVVVLGFGLGPFRLPAPCRVLDVHDGPEATGFTYGTLPGHPESGEERFSVVRRGAKVLLEVTAFSRPGRWFTKAAGPLGPLLQAEMVERYRRALDR